MVGQEEKKIESVGRPKSVLHTKRIEERKDGRIDITGASREEEKVCAAERHPSSATGGRSYRCQTWMSVVSSGDKASNALASGAGLPRCVPTKYIWEMRGFRRLAPPMRSPSPQSINQRQMAPVAMAGDGHARVGERVGATALHGRCEEEAEGPGQSSGVLRRSERCVAVQEVPRIWRIGPRDGFRSSR